ncbi:MAG: ABC transporter permease, partial [Janthinobacterium lividum]
NGIWTLAGLTVREAIRRRIFFASLVIAAIYIGFAFLPLHIRAGAAGPDAAEAGDNPGRIFAWLGCGTIKFFGAVLAVALSAGAISAEVDRGVLAVIVPKPIPRAAVYLGKWLGIVFLMAVSVAIWGCLLTFGIWRQTGTYHPHIWGGILAAGLFPLLFTTLTLCFSTFAGYALSSSLALIAAGVALAEDVLHSLSQPFLLNSPVLDTLSRLAGYVVPLGRMNHWITRGLGDAGKDLSVIVAQRGHGEGSAATTNADMTYILIYIAFFFALGLITFQRRDL